MGISSLRCEKAAQDLRAAFLSKLAKEAKTGLKTGYNFSNLKENPGFSLF